MARHGTPHPGLFARAGHASLPFKKERLTGVMAHGTSDSPSSVAGRVRERLNLIRAIPTDREGVADASFSKATSVLATAPGASVPTSWRAVAPTPANTTSSSSAAPGPPARSSRLGSCAAFRGRRSIYQRRRTDLGIGRRSLSPTTRAPPSSMFRGVSEHPVPAGKPCRRRRRPSRSGAPVTAGTHSSTAWLFQRGPALRLQRVLAVRVALPRPPFLLQLIRTEMDVLDAVDSASSTTAGGRIATASEIRSSSRRACWGPGGRSLQPPLRGLASGLRGGPVRSHLTSIVGDDGNPQPAAWIVRRPVQRIIFDSRGGQWGGQGHVRAQRRADCSGGGDPAPVFAPLAPWGRVSLAGGAPMRPRWLMLSGRRVRFQRHDEISA